MANKEQSQQMFDALLVALTSAFQDRKGYFFSLNKVTEIDGPLTVFLKKMEEIFQDKAEYVKHESFIKAIYKTAFLPEPILKSKNHLSLTLKIERKTMNLTLSQWIDLDNLSYKVNEYFETKSMQHRFEYRSGSSLMRMNNIFESGTRMINSIESPDKRCTNYLIMSVLTGLASACALLIAAFSVANVVSLGSVGLVSAVVTSMVAGAVSLYFFQNKDCGYTNPNPGVSPEPKNTLGEFFEQAHSHIFQDPDLANTNDAVFVP